MCHFYLYTTNWVVRGGLIGDLLSQLKTIALVFKARNLPGKHSCVPATKYSHNLLTIEQMEKFWRDNKVQ